MNLNLTGKNAIVCGSSQGLGLASAIELSQLGANVTLFSRNGEKLKDALLKLDTSKGQAHGYLIADFDFPEQVRTVILSHLKKHKVDILINNSGGPKGGSILQASPEEFINGLNRHLICNQILAQAVIPGMKESGFGRIINIVSISVKEPIPGLGVSNTVRGAVASWSKTLAGEAGPYGITVNNVLPGYTRTERYNSLMRNKSDATGKTFEEVDKEMMAGVPLRRIGEPDDFGAVVAFLCSPSAGYITGINLPVDGGFTKCF